MLRRELAFLRLLRMLLLLRCCVFVSLLQHEAWPDVPKVAPTHAAARLVRVSDDMHLRHVALTNAHIHYEMSYA